VADPVQIRAATDGDTAEILNVMRAALGETPLLKRTAGLFEWKHAKNPFGPSIVLVAEVGDRVVGVRSLMRWELESRNGALYRCVRPVDTATHPEFARRGIFRVLTESALDVAREDGVDLVFNTPNPKSFAGYVKMGWNEVGWIGAYIRPRVGKAISVDPEELPTLEQGIPAANPYEPAALVARDPIGLRTPRTNRYLSWRFMEHPRARYGWIKSSQEGGAVVRVSSRNGRSETVVTDLLGDAGAREIREVTRSSRARYVATWFAPGTPELSAVVSGGMFKVPGLKTLRLVALPLSRLDIDVTDLRSWDFATSDLELL